MKICVIGCGLRTPLLVYGLTHSSFAVTEICLYDVDASHARLMAILSDRIASATGTRISAEASLQRAAEDADFVFSSFRAGDIAARARDERIALDCGFAAQETTGPAGFAMALRSVRVACEHAALIEKAAPGAWIVNFTNPASIVTQAVRQTRARIVGICDTPSELFHQIARSLGRRLEEIQFDYFGLNHLGWVRGVYVNGNDVISHVLDDPGKLRGLYPAELFDPVFLQFLRLIPTEYLYFYYNQPHAIMNQRRAGTTRGQELEILNRKVWADLERLLGDNDVVAALEAYRRYLNRRNASYMRLEGAGESAFRGADMNWEPFESATGYHRIAADVITGLSGGAPQAVVLNVANRGAIAEMHSEDVVEVPCYVDHTGPRPLAVGNLPDAVRGLVFSVKQYERLTIEAAVAARWDLAVLALASNPLVGSWDAARRFMSRLASADTAFFGSFTHGEILEN